MLKTLWTVTAAGLLALCTTGCGGGTDYPSKICDRLKSCYPTTDVAACKTANQKLSTIPDSMKSQVDQEIDACLTQACPLIQSCLNDLPATDYPSKICYKAKACGYTTDVASCRTSASQGLSSVPSAQEDAINKMLDQCLAMMCSAFQSCLTAVESQTGATGGTAAPSSY